MRTPLSPQDFRTRLEKEAGDAVQALCLMYETGYEIRYGLRAKGDGRGQGYADPVGELATADVNEDGEDTRMAAIRGALLHACKQRGPTVREIDKLGMEIHTAVGIPAAKQQARYESGRKKRRRRRRKAGIKGLAEEAFGVRRSG